MKTVAGQRSLFRSVILALGFALLSSPAQWQHWLGDSTSIYVVITCVLAAIVLILVFSWTRKDLPGGEDIIAGAGAPTRRIGLTVAFAATAGALFCFVCHGWLDEILTIPIDPFRADMLVVVREGLRRVLSGSNPYAMYHVPWAAPLPYGPVLWAPYFLPMLLHLDLRFLSVSGELFIPLVCAATATASAARRRFAPVIESLVLLGAIGLNRDLRAFTSIAHTPVYWPLLAFFAWLVARRYWPAAAVLLALLVLARSTMLAIVLVFLMAVWRERPPEFARVCLSLAAIVLLALLPFAIANPTMLVYALYGSYEAVIKTVVWSDAAIYHTIGITGILIAHHLERWVELFQIVTMAGVWLLCWGGLRRNVEPLALMGLSLWAFSMTTLWPVTYIYFDVLLLFCAGVLVDMPWLSRRSSISSLLRAWGMVAAGVLLSVAVAGWAMLRSDGTNAVNMTWRDGPLLESVTLLRPKVGAAVLDVRFGQGSEPTQLMAASLNGLPLDVNAAAGVGDRIRILSPASFWHIGANNLELRFSSRVTIREVQVQSSR